MRLPYWRVALLVLCILSVSATGDINDHEHGLPQHPELEQEVATRSDDRTPDISDNERGGEQLGVESDTSTTSNALEVDSMSVNAGAQVSTSSDATISVDAFISTETGALSGDGLTVHDSTSQNTRASDGDENVGMHGGVTEGMRIHETQVADNFRNEEQAESLVSSSAFNVADHEHGIVSSDPEGHILGQPVGSVDADVGDIATREPESHHIATREEESHGSIEGDQTDVNEEVTSKESGSDIGRIDPAGHDEDHRGDPSDSIIDDASDVSNDAQQPLVIEATPVYGESEQIRDLQGDEQGGGTLVTEENDPPAPSRGSEVHGDASPPERAIHGRRVAKRFHLAASNEAHHSHSVTQSAAFMCRVCGAQIAHADAHLHDVHLQSRRVVGTRPEPSLGVQGTLHLWERGDVNALTPASVAPTIATALFRHVTNINTADSPAATPGSESTPELVAGFVHSVDSCSVCSAKLGWRFARRALVARQTEQDRARSSAASSLPVTATEALGSARATVRVAEYTVDDEAVRLAALDGLCLTLPQGWWTYEWCHRKRVRQFHISATTAAVETDWSLGDFAVRQVERVAQPTHLGYYTSHFFRGGQRCDETDKGRATEVQFLCCARTTAAAAANPTLKLESPSILGISEPHPCSYVMLICIPTLCVKSEDEVATTSLAADAHLSASEIDQPVAAFGYGSVDSQGTAAAAASTVPVGDISESSDGITSTPLPSATPTLPGDLPEEFHVLLWGALLGDESDVLREATEGGLATGIAPVKFA